MGKAPEKNSKIHSPSILSCGVVFVFGTALILYLSLAIYTSDLIWFWPVFAEQPSQIVLRCYGQDIEVQRQSVNFNDLTNILNEQLSGDKRWEELPLTDVTYQDYLDSQDMVVVRFFYPEPVRIHSHSIFYSKIDQLLVPLVGRHANTQVVFGLTGDKATGGSLHVKTVQPLLEYIHRAGLCLPPEPGL